MVGPVGKTKTPYVLREEAMKEMLKDVSITPAGKLKYGKYAAGPASLEAVAKDLQLKVLSINGVDKQDAMKSFFDKFVTKMEKAGLGAKEIYLKATEIAAKAVGASFESIKALLKDSVKYDIEYMNKLWGAGVFMKLDAAGNPVMEPKDRLVSEATEKKVLGMIDDLYKNPEFIKEMKTNPYKALQRISEVVARAKMAVLKDVETVLAKTAEAAAVKASAVLKMMEFGVGFEKIPPTKEAMVKLKSAYKLESILPDEFFAEAKKSDALLKEGKFVSEAEQAAAKEAGHAWHAYAVGVKGSAKINYVKKAMANATKELKSRKMKGLVGLALVAAVGAGLYLSTAEE